MLKLKEIQDLLDIITQALSTFFLYIAFNILSSGGNLTMMTVTGAGHVVPVSKPGVARQMFKDFVSSVNSDLYGSVKKPHLYHSKSQCEI